MKEKINPFPLTEIHILGEGTGIFGEILLGAKLPRVHENRDNDTSLYTLGALVSGKSFGSSDQRGVPLVQGSHGGNKNNR